MTIIYQKYNKEEKERKEGRRKLAANSIVLPVFSFTPQMREQSLEPSSEGIKDQIIFSAKCKSVFLGEQAHLRNILKKRSINVHTVISFHLPEVLYRSTLKILTGMPQGNARPAAHVSLDMIR